MPGTAPREVWVPPEPLAADFYDRPAEIVAPDLLGRYVWSHSPEGTAVLRIVEVEAYGGTDDPGSHGYRGKTPRNHVMFGGPGHAYIYFTYGMHHCLNFVTDLAGRCSAVLIRAGEPVFAGDLMARRRGRSVPTDLASGPGKLTQALSLTRAENGVGLSGEIIGVGGGHPLGPTEIVVGERVGVREGTHLKWRFAEASNPHVSRPAPRCQFRSIPAPPG